MVATISRIRDAITSLFSHSNKIPFHKRHLNNKYKSQVHKTRVHSCKPAKCSTHYSNASNNSFFTRAQANNYNRKFISRFNCHANHLLKSDTTLASRIQSQNSNCHLIANSTQQILHIKMSAKEASQSNPLTSPQTPRVTFRTQPTPISSTRAGPSNAQASSSPEEYDIELSREEIFENNLNWFFTKSFLAVLTSKDAVLKEIRDCVLQDDEARCKEVSTYIHSFWKDLHVKSGCLCVDQRVAIPNSIKEAVLESIHMTHPGSWGMISLSQYAWWPYMHREILAKTSDCVPCTDIDAETVSAEDLMDEDGWISANRSDIAIEQKMCQASLDADQRYRESDNKEPRFITHPQITDPIPRAEQSLKVKLARKLPNKKRAKTQLAGLYEVLKPGSFVTKSSPTTTTINEPGRSPVKVRDSDLAKFGTKAERSTNLWVYAQRRPPPYEKTTEFKIAKHSNDLKKQKRGEIKIRHRQRDTTSVVSSLNSNVSRALMVRKRTKPQLKRRHNVISDDFHEDVPAPDQPLVSIVPAPPVPASQVSQSPHIPPHRTIKQKAASATDPNFMDSRMRIFPQQVPWPHQVQLNQRSE